MKNNYQIKELNYNSEKDRGTIIKFSRISGIDNGWSIQTRSILFEENDKERTKVFVAYYGSEIIGFITFYKPPDILYAPSHQPFIIWDLYVEHDHRKKRIGTDLVNKYFEIEKISNIPIVSCPISDGMKGVLPKISNRWLFFKDYLYCNPSMTKKTDLDCLMNDLK